MIDEVILDLVYSIEKRLSPIRIDLSTKSFNSPERRYITIN